MNSKDNLLDKIASLAKRRGFIYPSSEIYGGLANSYDYGPLGTSLKNNIQKLWWKKFVTSRQNIYGIDSSVIINPAVWEASGHLKTFGDVMIEDVKTKKRYRADHIIEDFAETNPNLSKSEKQFLTKVDGKSDTELQEILEKYKIKSPDGNIFTQARKFNLLFETEIGVVENGKNKAFLRGEIAQGLFMNFKNIIDSFHPKLPFGIAQAGKTFRNEITKGKFTFRTLEFDLMEFEYFFNAKENDWNELFDYWKKEINDFATLVGLNNKKLRWRQHEEFELSHYSDKTEDLEYEFPWGYKEMFALAYRTDFDLKNHMQKSGQDLLYTKADGTKVLPHVLEPTFGLSRLITIVLMDAYTEETIKDKNRVVLKLDPKIAPIKAGIFPLQKDEKLLSIANDLYKNLNNNFEVEIENKGNIGKMYSRHDEIGTPVCITVDYETINDNMVTLRDRDTMSQKRVHLSEVKKLLTKLVK